MVIAVDELFHSWFFCSHILYSSNLNVCPRSLMTLTAFLWIFFRKKRRQREFETEKFLLAEIGEVLRHPTTNKTVYKFDCFSTRRRHQVKSKKETREEWWDKSEKIKFYLPPQGLQWMWKFTNYNLYRLKHCLFVCFLRKYHACFHSRKEKEREAVMFI